MGKYVIGIDAGTMGVRCVIFDLEGNEISSAYFETPTVYPKPGWVEQDANDVIELAYKSVAKAIEKKNVDTSDHLGKLHESADFLGTNRQGWELPAQHDPVAGSARRGDLSLGQGAACKAWHDGTGSVQTLRTSAGIRSMWI